MKKLKITLYGNEAYLFNQFLEKKNFGIYPIKFSMDIEDVEARRFSFLIKSEKPIEYFFIGEAWAKYKMIYALENTALSIPDDYE